MDELESKALFQQVRVAHRMAVAYYKRLFQLLKEVTNDERFGLNFLAWDTNDYSRPCQRKTNVFESWEWDLLPGISTHYVFYNGKSQNEQSEGDWLLDCHVITDTGILGDWGGENKDPLDLNVSAEDASSVLKCHLQAPVKAGKLKWYEDIWKASSDLECTKSVEVAYVDDKESIMGCSFEIPLDDLTGSDASEKLVQKIIEFRDVLLTEIKEKSKLKDATA
jgi:hypothetical protein